MASKLEEIRGEKQNLEAEVSMSNVSRNSSIFWYVKRRKSSIRIAIVYYICGKILRIRYYTWNLQQHLRMHYP